MVKFDIISTPKYNKIDIKDHRNSNFLSTKPFLLQLNFTPYMDAPIEFIKKYYIDDLSERDTQESKWALSWLKFVRGEKILSVGCGPNFYDDVQYFANVPKEFFGIDINKNNIVFLKESNHPEVLKWKKFLLKRHVNFKLVNEDILKKHEDYQNRFDSVYSMGVLGMFDQESTGKIFKILNSYLKVGGMLIDIDWTDTRLPLDKLKERKCYRWYSKDGPDMDDIGGIINDSGFKILKNEIHNVPHPNNYGWGKIYVFIAQKNNIVT